MAKLCNWASSVNWRLSALTSRFWLLLLILRLHQRPEGVGELATRSPWPETSAMMKRVMIPPAAERDVMDIAPLDVGVIGLAENADVQAWRGDLLLDGPIAAPDLHAAHRVRVGRDLGGSNVGCSFKKEFRAQGFAPRHARKRAKRPAGSSDPGGDPASPRLRWASHTSMTSGER